MLEQSSDGTIPVKLVVSRSFLLHVITSGRYDAEVINSAPIFFFFFFPFVSSRARSRRGLSLKGGTGNGGIGEYHIPPFKDLYPYSPF